MSEVALIADAADGVVHDRDRTHLRLAAPCATSTRARPCASTPTSRPPRTARPWRRSSAAATPRGPNQRFPLKQLPAHLRARRHAVRPHARRSTCGSTTCSGRSGRRSTARGPRDRVHTTATDDDGADHGDVRRRRRGRAAADRRPERARRPTARASARRATSRAGALTTLLGRPARRRRGHRTRAGGRRRGPRAARRARRNAPLTVLTLDRAVSLRDYEDFARGFAGIAKAHATWFGAGPRAASSSPSPAPAARRSTPSGTTHASLLEALRALRRPARAARPCRPTAPRTFRLGAARQGRRGRDRPSDVLDAVRAALLARVLVRRARVRPDRCRSTRWSRSSRASGRRRRRRRRAAPLRPAAVAAVRPRLFAALPVAAASARVTAAELLTLDPGRARARGAAVSRRLFELLPAVHRLRDAAVAGTIPAEQGPLEALLDVLAEQVAVLEEDLEQLYDDQFIETCAPWVVPYIGDLIGYRPLHGRGAGARVARAEVAHTIALPAPQGHRVGARAAGPRRHGLGRAGRRVLRAARHHAVHEPPPARQPASRRRCATPGALDAVGTAFDAIPRTLDVRRIASGRGRHNIPNVGVFLWRIGALPARALAGASPRDRPAAASASARSGPTRRSSPGPRPRTRSPHLAEPINVPAPIGRGTLARHLDRYYGPGRSIAIHLDAGADPEPASRIAVCDLRDDGAGWAHDAPAGRIAIDPELGRLVVAADLRRARRARRHLPLRRCGDLGGGDYARADTFESPTGDRRARAARPRHDPGRARRARRRRRRRDHRQRPLRRDAHGRRGRGRAIELRARPGPRPTLELAAPLNVARRRRQRLRAQRPARGRRRGSSCLRRRGLRRLRIAHCTLVPGRSLTDGGPGHRPRQPSVQVRPPGTRLEIERSITGPLRVRDGRAPRSPTASSTPATLTGRAYSSTPGGTAGRAVR